MIRGLASVVEDGFEPPATRRVGRGGEEEERRAEAAQHRWGFARLAAANVLELGMLTLMMRLRVCRRCESAMRVQELEERIALVARALPLVLGGDSRDGTTAKRRSGEETGREIGRGGRGESDGMGIYAGRERRRKKKRANLRLAGGEIVGAMQAKVAASGGFS